SEQKDAVVKFIVAHAAQMAAAAASSQCKDSGAGAFVKALSRPQWNGWSPDQTNARFQSARAAGLDARDVPRLKLKWAYGFEGVNRAFAAPTVVGGRVFVGSANGKIYSIDAASGCTHWTFSAARPVRGAVVVHKAGDKSMAYFGDQGANAYGVDAVTGK